MSTPKFSEITEKEFSRLVAIIAALEGDPAGCQVVAFPGEPHSKERARHARRGRFVKTYQSDTDGAAEARTAAMLSRAITAKFTGNVALAAIFYRSTMRNADYDNLLKHVGDAANAVIWGDDSQVTAGAGIVEYDPVRPRSILMFAPHSSTMKRGTDAVRPCEACGEDFPLSGVKRFCGIKCSAAARRKDYIRFGVTA